MIGMDKKHARNLSDGRGDTYLTYLTLPVDVLVRTPGNHLLPETSIFHACGQLLFVVQSSVFLQDINEGFHWTTLLTLPMLWLPQH